MTPDIAADRDSSYTPDHHDDATYKPATPSGKAPGKSHIRCIATHLAGSAAGKDHRQAALLNRNGVWLGDYAEETAAVNGRTQNEVEQAYFVDTMGGKDCNKAEPYVVDECVENEVTVMCAACKLSGAECSRLSIEMTEFDWEDDDDFGGHTGIKKHVSLPNRSSSMRAPVPRMARGPENIQDV